MSLWHLENDLVSITAYQIISQQMIETKNHLIIGSTKMMKCNLSAVVSAKLRIPLLIILGRHRFRTTSFELIVSRYWPPFSVYDSEMHAKLHLLRKERTTSTNHKAQCYFKNFQPAVSSKTFT